MSDPLVLGIPSKGRLKDASAAYLEQHGITLVSAGNDRSYRGRIDGMGEDVEVAFLSAPEIAREIAAGAVHLGVTGLDQLAETVAGADDRVELIAPLGFGHCEVVVAVPEAWIDVDTMADLDDVAGSFRPRHGRRLTVATKYINTTRAWFADHGIADYRIVESLGATEGAPSTGAADLIVDITSTGSTLKANGLKILDDGVILSSEAHLAASLRADWTGVSIRAMGALATALRKKGAYKRLARRAGFKPAA